nr:hypothetical protein [Escherichia coli]
MQVERNSVWQVTRIDGIKDGMYRVLEHYANDDLLILFGCMMEKLWKSQFQ